MTPEQLKAKIGKCARCGQGIPQLTIGGEESRDGLEFKKVLGDSTIMWHHLHPMFPDCYTAEIRDPRSPWSDFQLGKFDDTDEFERMAMPHSLREYMNEPLWEGEK